MGPPSAHVAPQDPLLCQLQHAQLYASSQHLLHVNLTSPACAGLWAVTVGRAAHALSRLRQRLDEGHADAALGAAALRAIGSVRKAVSQERMACLARRRDMRPIAAQLAESKTWRSGLPAPWQWQSAFEAQA